MKKQPKEVWMAGCNLGGLWSVEPVRGFWNNGLEEWYDATGNLSARTYGLDLSEEHIATFISVDKKDVENFIAGAKVIARQLKYVIGF